jgi:hypothetical protein
VDGSKRPPGGHAPGTNMGCAWGMGQAADVADDATTA